MSENNEVAISLVFDKAATRLAGYPYGKKVYDEQVKPCIDFKKKNVIIFPDNIERAATSFVQGFFYDIVKNIGFDGIDDHIYIKSNSNQLVDDITDNIRI
jgi:hypothetical protein